MKPYALVITVTLALAAEAVPVAAQTSLPSMVPLQVSKEGNPADLAGVEEVDASDPLMRIWGGGGRRRNAWEPNSRDRNFGEEYKDLLTRAVAYEVDVSSMLQSERRLFTLTNKEIERDDLGAETVLPARLRVDNIQDQKAPSLHQPEIVFPDDENPIFMRVAPDDKLLLVGVGLPKPVGAEPGEPAPSAIHIFDYSTGTLVEASMILLPHYVPSDPNPNLTGCGTYPHFFIAPQDAQIAYIQTVETAPGSGVWLEERMAIVAANMSSPIPPPPCKTSAFAKQTRGLLVLNLNDPANPFWYDTDLSKQAWDPCRTDTSPTAKCDDWYTAGFCHVRAMDSAHPGHPLRDFVYLTGGPEIGIRRIDLTDVANPALGIPPDDMFELWSIPGDAEGLFTIRTDPEDSDILYVYGRRNAFVVDRQTLDGGPVSYQKNPSDLNFANAGDAHLVLVDPGAGAVKRESWTLARLSADHVLRVVDFSQDGIGGLDAPDTDDGRFSVGPCDGSALHFASSSVYALTFAGVARWAINGSEVLPAPDSYKPALGHTTEALALAELSNTGTPSDLELLGATAVGGFVSWKIDQDPMSPDYLDPQDALYWAPPPPMPGMEGFWPAAPGYGNDIDVWDNAGEPWVVLDFSSSVDGEIGIGSMRWSDGFWPPQAIKWKDDGSDTPPGWAPIKGNVRDIDVHRNCVAAGANNGFITSRIPMQAVTDHVYTNDIGGLGFNRVMGVAIYSDPADGYPDRLFVSLGDTVQAPSGSPNNRFAFAMYGFDPVNGIVVDASGNPTESPIQVLFDGQPGKPDDFLGAYVGEGQKVSLVKMGSNPLKLRLFSGSNNGVTLDIEYDGSTDLMTPKSVWQNGGYFGPVEVATPYKIPTLSGGFGPSSFAGPGVNYVFRLLVNKNQETFEIVCPPDLPMQ